MAVSPTSLVSTSAADSLTGGPAFLELEGVSKAYGRRAALRDVTLRIPAGCCLALLGPNGAGKSTLLRLAAGLSRPTAGRVLFEGSPADVAARLRPRVGYLAHQTLLYGTLTARQNLTFFGRLYGIGDPGGRASGLLREVGLERHGDRAVETFSRGMQQRLALARALVHDPPLLLLDEPTTGLDPDGIRRLGDLLADLRSRGATLLVATHALDALPDLADSVAILSGGELRHHGAAAGRTGAEIAELYSAVTRGPPSGRAAGVIDGPPSSRAPGLTVRPSVTPGAAAPQEATAPAPAGVAGTAPVPRDAQGRAGEGPPSATRDAPGRAGPSALAGAGALLAKDLLVEWRRKERVAAMAVFALLAGVLFVFAVDPTPAELARLGPGALWISFLFAGTLGLAKVFAPEERNGALTALLLAPVDRTVLFLAKAASAGLMVAGMEALMTPVFVAMYDLPLLPVLPRFAVTAALATAGFCLLGTLLAFTTAESAARELLLPILLLPMTLPLLIAAAKATRILLEGPEVTRIADWHLWVTLMVTFDVVFGVLCCWGFERAVEE